LSKRDDFSPKIKEALARRVGFRCSNPSCQKPTIGPSSTPTGIVSIGVAAHITAAAHGGKRYDQNLTSEERKDFNNGIWLCQICAKLIDSDELKYTIEVLRNWKIDAENSARNNLEGKFGFSSPKMDRTLLAQATLLEQLGEMLSDETDKTIEEMRNTWREGFKEEARDQLNALKSDSGRWNILSNQVKAKILRFEAGLVLDSEYGLLNAKRLAAQAYDLDPSDENQSKINAFIARQEGSISNAIGYIENNKDIDSLNLLAALYLELGDNINCRKVLEGIDFSIANAETYRLLALLHLFYKDIELARENIKRAEQISPKWYVVKLNRAMIDFYSAISNALLPDRPILWPEPVTPDMVKNDKDSIAYLQNATNLFEELAKYEYPGVDSEIIRNWRLACQLVSFTRLDNIIDLVDNNLKANPADYYAIIWALELNYEFDYSLSERAIQDLLVSGKGTLFHVIALSGLLIKRSAWKDAERILNERYDLFKLRNAESLWQFWMVQLLGLQGKIDEANKIIDRVELDQNLRYAKGLVLSVRAQETGSNIVIVDYLEQQFAETKDSLFLLQVCRLKFREHDWKFISARAGSLVDSFQTAEILRFALVATFNSRNFGLFLELLEKNHFMFGDEIPGDIRRLKAISLREQGLLKAAIAEMEVFPLQSTQGLFQMAHMYLQQGDLKKLTLIGRQLVEKHDLDPVEALQLAHYLRQEDPELAKELLKKAEAGNLPSMHLGALLFTAFNLGLDNETKPIHELIDQAKEEETGLKLISLDDLKNFIVQDNLEAQKIQNLFMMGDIPVHLFAQRRNINLVHLYHTILENNEKESGAFSNPPMFVRHGGKPITDLIQNPSEMNLYVDITSILLAEHLGILESVEKAFNTINIPPGLILSLVEIRNQLLPHQPSQVNAATLLVDLTDQGKLKVLEGEKSSSSSLHSKDWDGVEPLVKYAQDNSGKVLVFKSTIKEKLASPTSDTLFLNARHVIDTLQKHGKISPEKHSELIELLGTEGAENDGESDLQIGMSLYCWQNSIDLFAGAGVLELICNQFEVYIQPDFMKQQKQEIQFYKQNEQASKWLLNLIEKLRRGIDSEKYQFMSVPHASDDDGWEFDPFNNLKALFAFPKIEQALIWSDDRYLNSFSNRDGISIIGVNEILNTLVLSGSIDQQGYFSVLNRTRASNLLFIPLMAEEICYFLLRAPRQESRLIETSELAAIKSYAMRALQLADYLQKPAAGQANQQGEIAFLFQYAHAPLDAIGKIWESNDLSVEEKCLCSDWIVENLFVDYAALASLLGIQQTIEHQEHLAAMKLMGLLIRGLSLPGKNKANPQSIRADYLDWSYDRWIGSAISFNSNVFKTMLGLLKQIISENKRDTGNQIPTELLNLLYQNFCSELPEPIRQALEEDDDFMAAIGVQFLINVGNYQFEADEFWNTIGQVAKVSKVKVTPKNCDYQISIVLDPTSKESGILSIVDPKEKKPLTIRIPEFEVLSPRKVSLISFLRKSRDLFDCTDQELTEIIDNIISAPTLRARVDRFLKSQEMNLGRQYSKLLERLRERQNFTVSELLPPNGVDVARFYHVNVNAQKSFSLIWKDSAASLLKSSGIVETLRRLMSVPLPLPETVYSRFIKLDPDRQKKHLKTLLQTTRSPVALMHLTKLLLRLGEKNPSYRRLGLQKLKYMLTEAYELEVKAFISVAKWTNGNLRVGEGEFASLQLMTIWSHAHQLYSILKAAGAPIEWIESFFSQNPFLPTRLFENERELRYDVSAPHNLTPQAMILNGIAYCVAGNPQDLGDEFRLGLANISFIRTDDRILPHPYLMDDVTTLTNHLESIWSGDRGDKLSNFLATDLSSLLSNSSLNKLLEGVLDHFDTHRQELPAWIDLFATTRGICIPENVKDRLVTALVQTDFCELFDKSIELGRIAFHLSSIVAYTTASDKLVFHLTEQLRAITKKFSQLYPAKSVNRLDEETQKGLLDTVGVLLEAAFNISKLRNTPEERVIAFAELGKEIAKSWDYFAIRSRPVIQALSEKLPVEQSKHMWRLLAFLRLF
jgi:hypothetical protein